MDSTYAGIVAVPLIVGLVEVCKRAGLPERFAPLMSMALGLGLSLGYMATTVVGTGPSPMDAVVVGLALGLSASGLYSSSKTAVEAKLGGGL